MAILRSCFCCKSLRRGSFASGFFSLTFYTVILTAGLFHVDVIYTPVLLVFSLLSVIFAGLCVISSVLLLVGLCVDNRLMLLPWIVCVSIRTILDLIVCFYFFFETEIDTVLGALFVVDISICALNIYSILCVISQYQEYIAGRGIAGQCRSSQQPVVFYCSTPLCDSRPKATIKATENGTQGASPKSHHLLVIDAQNEESSTGLWVRRTKKLSNPEVSCEINRSFTDITEYHERELSSDYADNDFGATSLCTEAEPLITSTNCRRALFRNTSDVGRTSNSSDQFTKAIKTSVSFASIGCLKSHENSFQSSNSIKSKICNMD